MKSHLNDSAARVYCVVITAAAMSLIIRLVTEPRVASITFQEGWIAAGSFVAVFGGVLVFLAAQGIAFSTLLNSLVLQHLRTSVNTRVWYKSAPLEVIWIPWALAGLATAVLISRRIGSQTRGLKVLFSAGALVGLAAFERHSLLGYVPPFSWLVLSSPSEEMGSIQSFPRTLLCGVAVLQSLIAFPYAGAQHPFVHVLLIVIVAVCAGDALVSLPLQVRPSPRVARGVAAALLIVVVAVYLGITYQARQLYKSLPALDLPGAERIHLDEQKALSLRWLTRNIENHCDVIFGLPNLVSLNFWTAKEPLTMFNTDAWILDLRPDQQMIVQTALSGHADACIVYNPDMVAFWNEAGGIDVEALPLVRYIREDFKIAGSSNQYYLLVRKERDLNAAQLSN
jgi:hypothetical protein